MVGDTLGGSEGSASVGCVQLAESLLSMVHGGTKTIHNLPVGSAAQSSDAVKAGGHELVALGHACDKPSLSLSLCMILDFVFLNCLVYINLDHLPSPCLSYSILLGATGVPALNKNEPSSCSRLRWSDRFCSTL